MGSGTTFDERSVSRLINVFTRLMLNDGQNRRVRKQNRGWFN